MTKTHTWGYEEVIEENVAFLCKKITMFKQQKVGWRECKNSRIALTCVEGVVHIHPGNIVLRPGESCVIDLNKPYHIATHLEPAVYLETTAPGPEYERVFGLKCSNDDFAYLAPVGNGVPAFIQLMRKGIACWPESKEVERTLCHGARVYGIEPLIGGPKTQAHPIMPLEDRMAKPLGVEATYVDVGGLVVKWHADVARAIARVHRMMGTLQSVSPQIESRAGAWYSYKYLSGETASPEYTIPLLDMCHAKLWGDAHNDMDFAPNFYRRRTLERLHKNNYPLYAKANQWKGWDLLESVPSRLSRGWHGDLCFENVIVGPTGDFWFIDIHEVMEGDLYYDIAKVLKSLRFRHSTFRSWPDCQTHQTNVMRWARDYGFNEDRLMAVYTVIFLKMAGIHAGDAKEVTSQIASELLKEHS